MHATAAHNARFHQPNALDCSRSLAALRGHDAGGAGLDPYAAALAEQATATGLDAGGAYDVVAARFVDDRVLHATCQANMTLQQEYNQVVLVGDGMCTRAFRLPWPAGTVIYLVAPPEVHERAEAVLRQLGARVPRGCLLRRVDADLQGGTSFEAGLERAGYRGSRLSVWALQGLTCLGLPLAAWGSILGDMSNAAAMESLLLGELPPMRAQEAQNLLASFGLIGDPLAYTDAQLLDGGRLWPDRATADAAADSEQRWLFAAQQRRLSLQQVSAYYDHVAAAEEAEDFGDGNFS